MDKGQADGQDLPLVVEAGRACSASFVSIADDVEGSLVLEGFGDSIPFRVCAPSVGSVSIASKKASNFVFQHGLLRTTVIAPARGQSCAQAPSPSEESPAGEVAPTLPLGAAGFFGIAAELSLSRDTSARLLVKVRRATASEVRHYYEEQRRRQEEAAELAADGTASGEDADGRLFAAVDDGWQGQLLHS